ncbi:MAG TPA: hypothetical protein PLB92_00255 [Rhodoglobus sp.]|nr:hypothetical protein [Rhodoglobus sp.]
MTATEIQIKNFTTLVTTWTADKLVDYFATCLLAVGRYEEIEIVRAEIKRRMTSV